MYRSIVRALSLSALSLGLSGGCSMLCQSMEMPSKPAVPGEMMKLQRMVGKWAGTAEMVHPSKEEMKKHMPPGAPEPQTSFGGGGDCKMDMGGMYLTCEGWYEMGEGQKVSYREYWTWCPKSKKYHTWMMNDWGEVGWGTAKFTNDNDMTFSFVSYTYEGKKKNGSGTHSFRDNNTIDWTYAEKCLWGMCKCMEFKGTSKRQ